MSDEFVKKNTDFCLKKLKETPSDFRVSATQIKTLKKYFKKELVNIVTGEAIDSTELRALIDENAEDEFCKFFGYYQIVTSELDIEDTEVIDKYHQLTQIENQFRMNSVNNPDLQKILNAFNIEIPEKIFTRQELKSLKKSIKIF